MKVKEIDRTANIAWSPAQQVDRTANIAWSPAQQVRYPPSITETAFLSTVLAVIIPSNKRKVFKIVDKTI